MGGWNSEGRSLRSNKCWCNSKANNQHWSDFTSCALLSQSVLFGKAQETFMTLSVPDRNNYNAMNEAVLKVYKLVSEVTVVKELEERRQANV